MNFRFTNIILQNIYRLWLSCGNQKECPICHWQGFHFMPFGIPIKRRFDAVCPKCGSLERHRLAKLVFDEIITNFDLFTLHIAPESCIEYWLRKKSIDYLSIDLYKAAMSKMDLTDLQIADETFTFVWCSHILEHIQNDRKAMSEMFRILKPGGIALIQVPIWKLDSTYENDKIQTKSERYKHFFQEDHVRLYGMDIVGRLASCGFDVEIRRAQDFGPRNVLFHSLSYISTNEVFICRKIDIKSQ